MSPSPTDSLRSGPDAARNLRIVTIVCTQAVRDACRARVRGIDAVVLGRAFVCGQLLMASAKRETERLRIQIAPGEDVGQVGQILVDVHGSGVGRAALQAPLPPEHPLHILVDEPPRPVVAPVVGLPGTLTLTRDLGLANRYQGHVDLVSAEIDEDLQAYLADSEQVASALRAEVRVDATGQVVAAAGVLVQALPAADEELIDTVRDRLSGGALYQALADGADHDRLAALALGSSSDTLELGPQTERPVEFNCPCGPQRARRVLSSLGADDLAALADEQPITEIRCNFCGEVTEVSAHEVRELANELRKRTN